MENKKLTYKEKLAIWTSSISFFLGWLLTIVNFFVSPIGEVSDSTLWILGQALIYVGSVIGITSYINTEINDLKRKIK